LSLHEHDQGATTHRSAFAIGDALAASLDHLIGLDEQRRWDCNAKFLRGFWIDEELEFGCC
jgi:hypothetical protein